MLKMAFFHLRKIILQTFSQTFVFKVAYGMLHACKNFKISHCANFRTAENPTDILTLRFSEVNKQVTTTIKCNLQ